MTSKIGNNPIALAENMKKKNVKINGVHVFRYFLPTFGNTIESRINCTTASNTVMKPEGTGSSCFKYLRTVHVIATKTSVATIHNINTCLVIEKLIPNRIGNCNMGCSSELLET